MTKTVFIKSYGCQMNVYDAGRMRDVLSSLGYRDAAAPETADLIILNTCHIREKASEKLFSDLGRLRDMKAARQSQGRQMMIAVAGCVAQAEGNEIVARAPQVDLVFGPQTYHRLPDFIDRRERTGTHVLDTDFPPEDKFRHIPLESKSRGTTAFLTVQEGCDKFCTFCVVPYTRGAEFSRPVAAIEAEAHALVDGGAREIMLLGQNVNAYHGEGPDGGAFDLARLIARLSAIEGLERIRYTTSHPRDMSDALIEAHARIDKLMPYLHLPAQSGSNRVLEAMNRRHTHEEYLALIAGIRAARPDIAIASDFIVGFPGETEDDFMATLDLIEQVRYASAYSFKYSPRPGTPAAAAADQVPEEVKAERLERLQQLIGEQQRSFNRGFIGKTINVLFDKPGRHEGQLGGRSPYLQAVHVDDAAARAKPGEIHAVEIIGAETVSLAGRLGLAREARAN